MRYRAICFLAAALCLSLPAPAQITFNVASLPAGICPAADAEVGTIVATATNTGTIQQGAQFVVTYPGNVVVPPSSLSGFSTSTSGQSVTYTALSAVNVTANQMFTFAGARINLQGKTGTLTAGLSVPGLVTFAGPYPIAEIVPYTFSPSSVSFQGRQGESDPPAQSLKFGGGGGQTSLSVATQSGGAWLTASPASGLGTLTSTVSAHIGSLAAGSYSGTITGSVGSTVCATAAVGLTVSQPLISVRPPELFLPFGGQEGGADPATQALTVDAGPLSWTAGASTTSGGNWLTISPKQGSGVSTITVTAHVGTLAGGSYYGKVLVTAPGAANSPVSVDVRLSVTATSKATIEVAPATLLFATTPGADPATQTFQIENIGSGTLSWAAAAATQSGGAWLSVSPASGTAVSTITVSVQAASLASAIYSGSVTITAANTTNSPKSIPVVLSVGVPRINDNGILNAASYAVSAPVTPGAIVSLFGVNLASGSEQGLNIPLPTILSGAQVLVNDIPAPLFYVSPLQINFQVPAEIQEAQASVVVVVGGTRSPALSLNLAPQSPGIFVMNSAGTGQGAVLNQDNTLNSTAAPAAPGSVIQIFASGLGVTNPPAATNHPGAAAEPLNRTVTTPAVRIGGVDSEVLFSGLAPGFVGLYQVNARLPVGTPAGNAVKLELQMGATVSNAATIVVR